MSISSRTRFHHKAFKALFLAVALLVTSVSPVHAVDIRTIDIAQINWVGSGTPSVTLTDVQNSLSTVEQNWKSFTSVEGDPKDRQIDFVYGKTLQAPIPITGRLQCDSGNFTSFVNAIRAEAYKQLGITDYTDRYLVILTPAAGCIWMGRALMGSAQVKGGSLVLHNTADAFVITHELGHSLGLGHSNLLRCDTGASDGPWGSSCRAFEYGGAIDVMGNVDVSTPLSTYHQWRMGLLDPQDIYQSWLNEKVTLNASDVYGGTRAIFLRDGNSTYWIEYRRPRTGATYSPGIVIYRGDPPPTSAVESPNPTDLLAADPGLAIPTDIWMLNLDSFRYSSTGKASGSMTLPQSKSATLYSNNISISFAAGKDQNSVQVLINRKPDTIAPPKPVLSDTSMWHYPDYEVLQAGYDDKETAISYFEAKSGDTVTKISPSPSSAIVNTYLNPLAPLKTLRVKDLPEGAYSLSIRATDVWGNSSVWSDPKSITVDRGAPNLTSTYLVKEATPAGAKIVLTDTKDAGSGLCETVLVNPEGLVTARSTSKSAPELILTSTTSASKIQTFDCLGNGREASFASTYSFISATDSKRTGKWSTTSTGALQCAGKCSASISLDGTAQAVVGSGSANITLAGKTLTAIKTSSATDQRLSDPFVIGKTKRVIRIEGNNLLLYGIAKLNVAISNFQDTSKKPEITDPTLSDASQLALSKYGFRASDFEQGWTVLPMANGTTLKDPSLDLCSSDYPSEADRVLRRQVAVTQQTTPYLFLSTEVVKYKSDAAARNALTELTIRTNDCIKNGGGTESNGTFTKYSFTNFPGESKGAITNGSSVFVRATIGEGANARLLLGFYQYKGSMFTGLYIVKPGTATFTDDEVKRWMQVAELMADRLNQ